jgi:hypothetical protein
MISSHVRTASRTRVSPARTAGRGSIEARHPRGGDRNGRRRSKRASSRTSGSSGWSSWRWSRRRSPGLIAFNAYVNEGGTELTVVQVHPDADSMLFHMHVARDHISEAYQSTLEKTKRIDVYGKPSDTALEMIKQLAGSEVPLGVKAHHLGGFTRSSAA